MPKSKLYIVPNELPRRERVPNNLPAQSSPLIGRDGDLDVAYQLLTTSTPEVRLLTMVGPGGVGKTRLALKLAEDLLHKAEGFFEQGVFFIELASIFDPGQLAPTIANALQVQEVPGTPLLSTLKEYLQGKSILLALDNFEQIVAAGTTLADLVASCPNLTLLVTSRSPLRIRAEQEFVVSPLALPDRDQHLSPDKLAAYSAVELFLYRVGKVEADFKLTESNANAVAEVCRRVDGLPLAIELVAAHSRLLSPQSILTRLVNPLPLLAGGSQDAGRHQTMRDTIEWSYNLLSEKEQRLFRRLSVFVAGFSLRAAECICNEAGDIEVEPNDSQAIEVLSGLESLTEKNLLRRLEQTDDGDRRLAMLATVREYAWEQLAAQGEAHAGQQLHARYYLALAEELKPNRATQEGMALLDQLASEQDNFRAALNHFLSANNADSDVDALRLLQALQVFWERHTQHAELMLWLEKAIAQAGDSDKLLQVWALKRGSIQASRMADYVLTGAWIDKALAIAREIGDREEIIDCINLQSRVAFYRGDYIAARAMMEEVLGYCRENGNDFMVAATLVNLGNVDHNESKYEHAEALYRESNAIFTALGNKIGVMWTLLNLGDTLRHVNKAQEAGANLLEALAMAREADHPLAVESLVIFGNMLITNLSGSISSGGNRLDLAVVEQIVRLFGRASALLTRRGGKLEPLLQAEYDQNFATIHAQLGEASFNTAWEEGQNMSLEQAQEIVAQLQTQVVSRAKTRGRPIKRDLHGLTGRELDVATLVARGMTNAETAQRLVLSIRTVEAHVANTLQKLGLHTRTELAAWALREGILQEDQSENT